MHKLKITYPVFVLLSMLYGLSYNLPIYVTLPAVILSFLLILKFLSLKPLSRNFLMLFSFLLVYAFFSITPSIFDSSLDGGVRNGSYLAFCLLPLFLQAYFIKLNKKELETGLLISFTILSLSIFLLFNFGIIDGTRYQQVGNLLGALSVLLLINRNYKLKLLSLIPLILMLTVGSRQALAGVLVAVVTPLILRNLRKSIITITLLFALGSTYGDSLLRPEKKLSIGDYELRTVTRLLYKLNSNEQNLRTKIWATFLDKSGVLPNGVFFGNATNWKDQPHNFFIEYIYVCGYIFGIPFFLIVFRMVVLSIKRNPTIGSLVLFFFVPYNLSSGLTAAKYFFLFIFILFGNYNPKNRSYFNYNQV